MAKLFIFAIGGTGERVLRSFTMMLASGIPTFDGYEVYPIIVDYDKDNADKERTVKLLQNYNNIHNAAYQRRGTFDTLTTGRSQTFFAAKLKNLEGLDNYVFPFSPAQSNEKFRTYIGYDTLEGNKVDDDGHRTDNTKYLLSSLYDESDRPDTELNLDMTVGFKGNPNIGSVVFHTIGSTDQFNRFVNSLSGDDKVVIIGSLFGGTGASGIPEIVKAIKNQKKDFKNVATLLVLPYFAPIAPREGGAIIASRFNTKTKAALTYYEASEMKAQIDRIYYVGDPYPTKIAYSEGGKDQKNNANLVELIGAMMIEHYVAGRDAGNKEFKFSLDTNIAYIQGKNYSNRIFIEDFNEDSRKFVLDYLVKLSFGLKIFKVEVADANQRSKGGSYYKYLIEKDGNSNADYKNIDALISELRLFYSKYQDWLKELDFDGEEDRVPANSHRFALCDMERNYSDLEYYKDGKRGKLDSSNVQTFMNKKYELYVNSDRQTLKENNYREWVFMECLYSASGEGYEKIKRK